VNHSSLRQLLETIFASQESEIACSEFFELLPGYVDQLSGSPDPAPPGPRLPDAVVARVAHHAAQCAECGEEFRALLEVTRGDP
jgi:hypothetical protein